MRMKIKLPAYFLLILYQIGFSQVERQFQAKITCDDFPLQGIEVLNLTSKKITKSDINGKFSVLVKVRDSLMFISKDYYYKKIMIDNGDLDNDNFIVSLVKKPEALDEVVVFSIKKFPKIKFDKNIANQIRLEKEANNPKPYGVYDGTIVNGMGTSFNLPFGKKKTQQIVFKELVRKNYNDLFFVETLKLKPDEIGLYLEFSDADPKSKTISENTSPLYFMDFLMSKKNEFRKMLALESK